jgi:hypothetical protein
MWAIIHADSGFGPETSAARKPRPLILTCRYPTDDEGRSSLVVEADHTLDPNQVVHAFLDLVIDDAPGRFRIRKAAPNRQYAFEPLDIEDRLASHAAQESIVRSA